MANVTPTPRARLVGFAARYPEIRSLASQGVACRDLQSRFRLPLSERDVAILASITDDEVNKVEQAMNEPLEDNYPYGV